MVPIIIIALVVIITVLMSLPGIIVTCHNSVALGSTKNFFSDIWHGSGGNIFVILGLIVLCIPVYIILNVVINIKKKNPIYRAQTRLAGDSRYSDVVDAFRTACNSGTDINVARQNALNELISKGINRKEAEETMSVIVIAQALNKD